MKASFKCILMTIMLGLLCFSFVNLTDTLCSAFAETNAGDSTIQQENDFKFFIHDGYAVTAEYTGIDNEVTVPAYLGGYPVKTVGANTFTPQNGQGVQVLVIEEGIEAIQYSALRLTSLKKLYLPSTLDLGFTVNSEGLQTGLSVFEGLPNLEKIYVDNKSKYLTVEDNILYNKDKTILILFPPRDERTTLTIPDGVIRINDSSCTGNYSLLSVNMPDTVRKIGYWAFSSCRNLKEIYISDNCEEIHEYAFSNTAIENLCLPASLTYIGFLGEWQMNSLKSLTVKEGNTEYAVENGLLFNYEKTILCYCPPYITGDVVLPDSLVRIVGSATRYSNFASITIPKGVSAIEDYNLTNNCIIKGYTGSFAETYALQNNHPFESIGTIEDTIIASGTIGDYLEWSFSSLGVLCIDGQGPMPDYLSESANRQAPWKQYNSRTLKIVIGENINRIGNDSFVESAAYEVIIKGNDLEEIGESAFLNCENVNTVDLPESVRRIENAAFWSCGLKSITIPSNVEYIGEKCFAFCKQLGSIGVSANNAKYTIQSKALIENEKAKLIAFPAAETGTYTIPENIRIIGGYAFSSSNLEKVIIPDTVHEMEKCAFISSKIPTVSIGSGVNKIADEMFINAYLDTLYFGTSIQSIGRHAITRSVNVCFHGTEDEWNMIEMDETSNLSHSARSIRFNQHSWIPYSSNGSSQSSTEAQGESKCAICGLVAENKIEQQPQSITCLENAEVSFSVSSTAAVSFNWKEYRNRGWYSIENTTAREPTLRIKATPDMDQCKYMCTIVYADGTRLRSEEAVLTVNASIEYTEPDFILPSSLRIIGEQAFMYIPAESVIIGESVVRIESLAFASCPNLKLVFIPNSVVEISEDAFYGCEDFVVICEQGSYAEGFAKQMGYICIIGN